MSWAYVSRYAISSLFFHTKIHTNISHHSRVMCTYTPSTTHYNSMASVFRQEAWMSRAFVLCVIFGTAQAQLPPFEQCRITFRSIINGSLSIGMINNNTIWDSGYLYSGTVRGLDLSYPRTEIITPTFLGCKTLCGRGTQLNLPATALGLVATWVFPLAILLSLPYESLHKKRFRGTASATLNWLGSPQTSLTATTYNLQLLIECRQRSKEKNNDPTWTNLFYVLSVFNQYDLPLCGLVKCT
ncbi:hypothetical protein CC86DRAFT_193190 [Ophiobolus disseminans]|uniref:Uncharacterized protein n=1 Tax=Ophiobolus disseminans TaxID=1469910 RepID=A0A6A7A5K1_9PLEO|nr:hypothetical protein CC86DRAFT_193190 [Ophiobolus disseminans]